MSFAQQVPGPPEYSIPTEPSREYSLYVPDYSGIDEISIMTELNTSGTSVVNVPFRHRLGVEISEFGSSYNVPLTLTFTPAAANSGTYEVALSPSQDGLSYYQFGLGLYLNGNFAPTLWAEDDEITMTQAYGAIPNALGHELTVSLSDVTDIDSSANGNRFHADLTASTAMSETVVGSRTYTIVDLNNGHTGSTGASDELFFNTAFDPATGMTTGTTDWNVVGDGHYALYRNIPVPEPGSATLGLLGMLLCFRRRR